MGRAQAAAAVVRRLNAAVKSRRLYEPEHTLRVQTVSALHAAVVAYHERFGSFVLETHRDGLVIEGRPFEGGESVDNLALTLYSLGVWQLVLLPAITEEQLSATLDVVSLEREAILAAGGFGELLAKGNLYHVRVFELRPGEEDATQITLEVYHQLLDGTLSPHERSAILGLLRGGPEQTQRLLTVIFERTRQAFPNASGQELAGRMFTALSALDRLIVDAPKGEAQDLLKELATAVAGVDDPKRSDLHLAVVQRAAGDLSARALLAAMTTEQIARMIIPCLEAGSMADPSEPLTKGLPFDPQKARDTLALLSQQTGRSFDLPPALEEVRLPAGVRSIQDLRDFQITNADVDVSDDQVQALTAELHLDDVSLQREQVLSLLNLVLADADEREVEATLVALTPLAERLLREGHHDLFTVVLKHLEAAGGDQTPKARRAQAALAHLISVIPDLVTAKDVAQWTDGHALLACLRSVGRSTAGALAQMLAAERDPSRRQVVAAVLGKLGDEFVEPLASALKDPNPDVIRTIVRILAQMGTPKALALVRTVAKHPDGRVRRETVNALAAVPTASAQTLLVSFLQDADFAIREQALSHLRPDALAQAKQTMISLLQSPELAQRHLFKMKIIRVLAETGATEALPVLRAIGSPLRLRKRDRQVARVARQAVTTLSTKAPARLNKETTS